ncbi:MAG: DUF805 domain-containing protein [Rhizomicrobium sp.]
MTATEYLFGFGGRINRAKWWLLLLIQLGAAMAYYFAIFLIAGTSGASIVTSSSAEQIERNVGGFAILLVLLSLGYGIGMFIVWLAVTVKRLHDRDKSGAWILLFALGPWVAYLLALMFAFEHSASLSGIAALTGFAISIWAFIELGCLRGTVGDNRFGPDPLPVVYLAAASAPSQQQPVYQAPPQFHVEPKFEARRHDERIASLVLSGLDRFSEYYLKIDSGELAHMVHGLAIGRDSDRSDFSVDDDSVSRQHARLSLQGQDFAIQDMGSTNGTSVNGRALRANDITYLRSGDRIAFGTAAFAVRIA